MTNEHHTHNTTQHTLQIITPLFIDLTLENIKLSKRKESIKLII